MKSRILLMTAAALVLSSCSNADFFFSGDAKYAYEANADACPADPGDMEEDPSGDRFDTIVENPFVKVVDEPQSTFSVDADGASYAYMRRCVSQGWLPQANAVRIEEYLNYFSFDYPSPKGSDEVALNAEVGPCPWTPEHRLMRLGIKGKSLSNTELPQANFVFLIDVSGSMMSEDKLPLLKKGLLSMLDYMNPDDRVAIVTYASGEKLALESTLVKDKQTIINAIKPLTASGSTAGASAMKMAYDQAVANYIPGANNRVIMGTDGDFNVGVTSTDALVEMVQDYASKGIYLSVMGFGMGNLNDAMMEQISNHGNGTYHYIDSELEMTKVFVAERERFVAVANDCKVQITFNPDAVESYRLIGYENRVMANEDFENDQKDAAEIGAGQTITALYEIVPAAQTVADAPCGTFDFRYKKALGDESLPLTLEIPAPVKTLSSNLSMAASIAAFGLTLRSSAYRGDATFGMALDLAENVDMEDDVQGCIVTPKDPYGLFSEYKTLLQKALSIGQAQ